MESFQLVHTKTEGPLFPAGAVVAIVPVRQLGQIPTYLRPRGRFA
jgi:hypothetical protein